MQKFQANNGFTLIELIVVLSLISVMFFVATPRFSVFLFGDDTDTTLRWLMIKIRDVKQRSVAEQKDYVLNLDFENNRMWMTDESLETDEDLIEARDKGYSLPEGLHLLDVEYFAVENAYEQIVQDLQGSSAWLHSFVCRVPALHRPLGGC